MVYQMFEYEVRPMCRKCYLLEYEVARPVEESPSSKISRHCCLIVIRWAIARSCLLIVPRLRTSQQPVVLSTANSKQISSNCDLLIIIMTPSCFSQQRWESWCCGWDVNSWSSTWYPEQLNDRGHPRNALYLLTTLPSSKYYLVGTSSAVASSLDQEDVDPVVCALTFFSSPAALRYFVPLTTSAAADRFCDKIQALRETVLSK
jgi:hypothetical protein